MADNNMMGSTVAVAVTAAILSPRVRGILRTGAVQGLAGVLIAGDAIASFAQGVGRGLRGDGASTPADALATVAAQEAARAAQEAAQAAQAAVAEARSATKPKASTRARKGAARTSEATSAVESES